MATSLSAAVMASFLFPTWGAGSPDVMFRLPVHHTSTASHQHKESHMISKFLSTFARKGNINAYAGLPEQIQDEIKAANEATSVYDIR
jgi:hypothetical protein